MNKQPLRVAHIPQVPGKAFTVTVTSLEEAHKLMTTLANYDLFLEAEGIRGDYSNVSMLEMFEDDEWVSWMDDETGIDDLDEYFAFINEEN